MKSNIAANPNVMIPTAEACKTLGDGERLRAIKHMRNASMIHKMLSLEEAIVTDRMAEFLDQEDVLKILISYLVRLDDPHQDQENTTTAPFHLQLNEYEATKYSFKVMMMLSQPCPAMREVIANNVVFVMEELLMALSPNSNANFYHFFKSFQFLIKHFAEYVIPIILDTDSHIKMLELIDVTPIGDSLLELFRCPGSPMSLRMQMYGHFEASGYLQRIVEKLTGSDEAVAAAVREFLCRMAWSDRNFGKKPEKNSDKRNYENLFYNLLTFPPLLSAIVDMCLHFKAARPAQSPVSTELAEMLYGLVLRAWVPTYHMLTYHSSEDDMRLNDPISAHIVDLHLTDLTEAIIRASEHASSWRGGNRGNVTHHSIILMDILCEVCKRLPHSSVEFLPAPFWKWCVNAFFKYPSHNIYSARFYRLFYIALHNECIGSFQVILQKHKFITRCIHALHVPHGAREPENAGHIVALLNLIRLKSSSLPKGSWMRHFLRSHHMWTEFQAELHERTSEMVYRDFPVKSSVSIAPVEFRKVKHSLTIEPCHSLELGGEFARLMGFEDTSATSPEQRSLKQLKKKLKKQRSKLRIASMEEQEVDEEEGNMQLWDDEEDNDFVVEINDPLSSPTPEEQSRGSPDYDPMDLPLDGDCDEDEEEEDDVMVVSDVLISSFSRLAVEWKTQMKTPERERKPRQEDADSQLEEELDAQFHKEEYDHAQWKQAVHQSE